LRIVFIGSVEFSEKALLHLIGLGASICGVVTKSASAINSDFRDLSLLAQQHHIPFFYTQDVNNIETRHWIATQNPDILFCFGWSNLIKKELLNISPFGVVGFHPTLLPSNRGRHPLIWSKVLGLAESGCTFFFMNEGADTGDIISQDKFDILFEDDARILYDKMTRTALKQLTSIIELMHKGSLPRTAQSKTEGNTWRKRNTQDGLIDFRMCTNSICNLVRAITKPYDGAHLIHNTEQVKIWKVEPGLVKSIWVNSEPGKILSQEGNSLLVKTGDASIWLTKHEFATMPFIGSHLNNI